LLTGMAKQKYVKSQSELLHSQPNGHAAIVIAKLGSWDLELFTA
jgi:hypothetical protein